MKKFKKFPFVAQQDKMDCGPACLSAITQFYGKYVPTEKLRQISNTGRLGTDMLSLSEAANLLGFDASAYKSDLQGLREDVELPCIVYWQQRHFIIVYKITDSHVFVSDPAHGKLKFTHEEFEKGWLVQAEGISLEMKPTDRLNDHPSNKQNRKNFAYVKKYVRSYKNLAIRAIFTLLIGSILQFILPFLTQHLVDTGINNKNLGFIHFILLGQLFLFLGKMVMDLIRNYALVNLSNKLNIDMLSDFFTKLMRLPIRFFDVKFTGDILQRIQDHSRIEQFITSSALQFLYSSVTIIVFGIVLCWFSPSIFAMFIGSSILYIIWIRLFMKKRAALDYKRFAQLSQNQEKNIEVIMGMPEIKLHGAETHIHNQWRKLQLGLYELNLKSTLLAQWQNYGGLFINELKNIIITYLAARAVLSGELTLGTMLSISFIIGQLNVPVAQMLDFMRGFQDASLSMKRVNEIYHKDEEEKGKR